MRGTEAEQILDAVAENGFDVGKRDVNKKVSDITAKMVSQWLNEYAQDVKYGSCAPDPFVWYRSLHQWVIAVGRASPIGEN